MSQNPGQISPSEELDEILKVIRRWIDRHDSLSQPFLGAANNMRIASEHVMIAIAKLTPVEVSRVTGGKGHES